MPKKAFGEVLRAARESKKLSQEKLALNAGISRNSIGSLEKGEFAASIDTLFKVADGLDMLPEELITETRLRLSKDLKCDEGL